MKITILLFCTALLACTNNKQQEPNYICDDNKITLDVRECLSTGGDESECNKVAQDEHCISIDF